MEICEEIETSDIEDLSDILRNECGYEALTPVPEDINFDDLCTFLPGPSVENTATLQNCKDMMPSFTGQETLDILHNGLGTFDNSLPHLETFNLGDMLPPVPNDNNNNGYWNNGFNFGMY